MADNIHNIIERLKGKCPICEKNLGDALLGEHIRLQHGEEELKKAILNIKKQGASDTEIGALFGISFRQLEKIITNAYGINISVLERPKKIKSLSPKNFKEETTTIWSFKKRGNWATHDGRYRGNWSPYIPRNLILKYTKPGDTVLDYFVGGGTTAIESKLLGRKCIALDINDICVNFTLENLKLIPSQELLSIFTEVYEPNVSIGDARELVSIPNNSIDLICAHPPYAGIISYSGNIEGDLSKLSIESFLEEMKKVASESYRVLKPGKKCAILIGDTRKQKYIVPIGFQTINVFLETGFKLKELVIKCQHNCKTTGFWYEKSIKYNFLLLAHEYLPIFEKPESFVTPLTKKEYLDHNNIAPIAKKTQFRQIDKPETSTVWIFPQKDFEEYLNENVIRRYLNGTRYCIVNFIAHSKIVEISCENHENKAIELLFIKSPFLKVNLSDFDTEYYLTEMKQVVYQRLSSITKGGFVVIQTQDVRIDGYIEPLAKRLIDTLNDGLRLKEIIIATDSSQNSIIKNSDEHFRICHQYLLVYENL